MIAVLGYVAILIALAGSIALVVTGIRASRSELQDPRAVRLPVMLMFGGGVGYQANEKLEMRGEYVVRDEIDSLQFNVVIRM